ncbi:DUF5011 domain-containing protein [Candidatus Parcubacteria bacterium]|nr:DUF5011 domain-containing protein [Candidatus Parcubacteria bacterium]
MHKKKYRILSRTIFVILFVFVSVGVHTVNAAFIGFPRPIDTRPTAGSIRICVMYANERGKIITDASKLPPGNFTIALADTKNFDTSLISLTRFKVTTFNPNANIISDTNDAQCVTYKNLKFGTYYYSEERGTGGVWKSALYSDKFKETTGIDSFLPYGHGDSVSDGRIILNENVSEKTLTVLNTFDKNTPPPQDNHKPVITVQGQSTVHIARGSNYVDQGSTATDAEDGDITSKIVKSGAVNVTTVGTYTIHYNVKDSKGLAANEVTRTVVVTETNPAPTNSAPKITLVGPAQMTASGDEPFVDPGATATDTEDGNITSKITKTGSVDIKKVGTYEIKYNVKDSKGLAAQEVVRTVVVVNSAPPPPPPPPQNGSNLILNPSFETAGTNSLPEAWFKGGWGTNDRQFSYPVPGVNNSKAAKVQINAYTSGDAKWYFTPIPVQVGHTYSISDTFKSTVPSFITLDLVQNDGTHVYKDIQALDTHTDWHTFTKTFVIPVGTKALSIFHLIKSVGSITVDDYSLKETVAASPPQFSEGMVSFNFDDGWEATYKDAIPVLDAAGFKSTQYLVSQYINHPNFMTTGEVLTLERNGHEIGAHTRTHARLTELTSDQAKFEIEGSFNELKALGVQHIATFAYPYGLYNDRIIDMIKAAGFSGARAITNDLNTRNTDPYILARKPMEVGYTFNDVKGWIDQAIRDKSWVILVFHHVDNSGDQFSVTPALFKQVVDYTKQTHIKVITNSQGIQLMK